MDDAADKAAPRPDWKKLRADARGQALDAVHSCIKRAAEYDTQIDYLIVELRDDLDMTIVDIAADTGMTVAIVTKRYQRGKGEG